MRAGHRMLLTGQLAFMHGGQGTMPPRGLPAAPGSPPLHMLRRGKSIKRLVPSFRQQAGQQARQQARQQAGSSRDGIFTWACVAGSILESHRDCIITQNGNWLHTGPAPLYAPNVNVAETQRGQHSHLLLDVKTVQER